MSAHRNAIKRQKKATKIITQSATETYMSQMAADPYMEQRKILQQAAMDRRVAEARKAMGR